MQAEGFEWDDAKAVLNWRKHAVSFEMARVACGDDFALEWVDGAQNTEEERVILLGMYGSTVLLVAYTQQDRRVRIMSARKAERHERRRYHDERGG